MGKLIITIVTEILEFIFEDEWDKLVGTSYVWNRRSKSIIEGI